LGMKKAALTRRVVLLRLSYPEKYFMDLVGIKKAVLT